MQTGDFNLFIHPDPNNAALPQYIFLCTGGLFFNSPWPAYTEWKLTMQLTHLIYKDDHDCGSVCLCVCVCVYIHYFPIE